MTPATLCAANWSWRAPRWTGRSIASSTGAISVFGGMMLAYAGLVVVLIAAAQALARVVPDWAASLIVGGIILLIGGVLALVARRALAPSGMVPERTIRNVRADAMLARDHVT